MKKEKNLEDETPQGEAFLGDLKYGRRFGKNESRNDYAANRDKEGQPTNLPIIPLIIVRGKDEEFWARVKRPKSKHYDNSALRATFLRTIAQAFERRSIKYNLTVVNIGAERFVSA